MIAASTIGIFLIPMLYVTFQSMRERVQGQVRRRSARLQARPDTVRRVER